jgi:hypothetical protein
MSDKSDKTSMEQLMKLFQKAQEKDAFDNEGDLMKGRSYIPRMSAAMKKALADAIKGAAAKRRDRKDADRAKSEELDRVNQENRLMIERILSEPSYHMRNAMKVRPKAVKINESQEPTSKTKRI